MLAVLLATRNAHKLRELRRILRGFSLRLIPISDFPDLPSVPERGSTFRTNAIGKALAASRCTLLPVLAEDSGLEVFALGGRPGVRSARYAGPALRRCATSAQKDGVNSAKLLREMADLPLGRRRARFVCVMVFAVGGKVVRTFRGICPGSIALCPAGCSGFGYDPIFIPRGSRPTMAQLPVRRKDRLSHRGRAARAFGSWLRKALSKHPER